ncbi:DUF500-domain-containing protein [Aspergillus taichungensis]|uniref:DUF500-domain-containing protein n=1 Tax=Aspergillus taichungensis TaxID=482145 RepID=A0A2J5I049_9EURO|nr:DUF500-domain-containing protein [Aspergillus taichungensis]
MAPPSFWERTKGTSKKGFDKAWHTLDKLGDPVNRLSYKVGAEAFWPMTIDKESDKAARILRSFCKDGFYTDQEPEPRRSDSVSSVNSKATGKKIDRPKGKQRVLQKIPTKVIRQAKGLAIFTTMRTGLWLSGSGGSGVLLGRIPETGEWSPPSGIMLHTSGIGFLAGVDIYDCVVVINTYEALNAFKHFRCTLGGGLSVAAGPVGMGGMLESEVHKRQAPIWTYLKSRGFYAGIQVDGTVVIERTDENERFFGERISVTDILAGKVKHPPDSIKTLMQTVRAAQGDTDVDESLVAAPGMTPGDVDVVASTFGVPAADDPDPFGVKALEAEGLFIREAGTRSRAHQDVFEFRPSPSSPIYSTYRRSLDSSPRHSWRASVQSQTSQDRGTQTDAPPTAATSVSRASSRSTRAAASEETPSEPTKWDHEGVQWEAVIPERHATPEADDKERDPNESSEDGEDDDDDDDDDDDFEIHEVSSATVSRRDSAPSSPVSLDDPHAPVDVKRQSPTFTRARLVTIPKRPPPPPVPPRNPSHRPSASPPGSPVSQRVESPLPPRNPSHRASASPPASPVSQRVESPLPPRNPSHRASVSPPGSPVHDQSELALPPRNPQHRASVSRSRSPVSRSPPSLETEQTQNGFAELPLGLTDDASEASRGASPARIQDKDEFHSVSSARTWDSASDTEASTKDNVSTSDVDARPDADEDKLEPVEPVKTVTEEDSHTTSVQRQTASVL